MGLVTDALAAMLPSDRYVARDEVLLALERFLSACDVRNYLAVNVQMPGVDPRTGVIATNWPELFLTRYLREGWWGEDPLVQATIAARIGLTEAAVRELVAPQPRAVEILAEYTAHGLTHHLTVPCIRIGAYHVVVVLSAGRALDTDEIYLVQATMRLLMERLSQVTPEAVARVGQLTARERQIVSMTATGLTSNEIAEILNISPRTVFAHLTAAGEKLSAANKTETVVKAFRYGQIAL